MNMQALWQRRRQAFSQEAMKYWQFVLRSNFVGYVFLLFILSTYYYLRILNDIPTDFPYMWISTIVLLPLLAPSPIRTYMQEADRMFLLPMEGRMNDYFRSSLRYSFIVQGIRLLLGLLAIWPLYRQVAATTAQPLWFVLGLLLLAKLALLLSAWQESRMVTARARAVSSLLRWLGAAVLIPLLLSQGGFWTAPLLIGAVAVWMLALRLVPRYHVGWETLIAREEAAKRRHYRFFSYFIDVPQLPFQMKARKWAAWVTNFYPFTAHYAQSYLFTKTLLRSDLLGMFLRTTIIGIAITTIVSSDTVRMIASAITLLLSAVQLSTLNEAHRYSFWLSMYPLSAVRQASAVISIMIYTLAIPTVVLTIVISIRSEQWLHAIVPLLTFAVIAFFLRVIKRRTWERLLESE
ncbi:ABC transporter permease [Paenibacillus sp. N1-5-1-14]|uniref:ABC transporter permease n=1 Tax=Paenibacillus radicibacter TaxID=2972488 RepID=UPI0021598EE3|nr:ABC transporter permease [Paenibacillus radicibacter]MCR8645879.1 ABC transporter permease [Paenibacillus radicibacter]